MGNLRAIAAATLLGCTLTSSAIAQMSGPAMLAANRSTEIATRPVADRALAAASGGRGEAISPLGTTAALSIAKLGRAIPVYFVRLDRLREYIPDSNPFQLLSPPTSVIYPVMAGPKAASLIEVSSTGPEAAWTVTTRGRPSLAAALAERVAAAGAAGDQQFCVWVAALNQRFYGSLIGGSFQLTPLDDTSEFDFRRGVSLPATTVFSRLQAAARALRDEPGL